MPGAGTEPAGGTWTGAWGGTVEDTSGGIGAKISESKDCRGEAEGTGFGAGADDEEDLLDGLGAGSGPGAGMGGDGFKVALTSL